MKNIFKIFIALLFLSGMAQTVFANGVNTLIKESKLDTTSTIAVSVKDAESGKVVYQYNEKKLLHPASTQKVFTVFPALDVLGEDYLFRTEFYVYDGNLIVKLGADPLLTSLDLKEAAKAIKALGYNHFKNVYFDDSVMDNVEWGVGWMWDDGTNKLMPKFSAYNLDGNLVNISVSKNENGAPVVKSPTEYSLPVLNAVKVGKSNDLYAIRHDWISPDIICINGTMSANTNVAVPVNNMKRYFQKRLFDYLSRSNIKIDNKSALNAQVPAGAKKVNEIAHFSSVVIEKILKDSDNYCAETYAKIAGGVQANSQANLANQVNVFYDYWQKNGLDTSEIVIADASGVSRNNLLNVDFMTNALNKLYAEKGADKMKSILAQPGEGTLSNRMLNHRGKVFLKTGTLSSVSGLTGYVIADNGKVYSVAILIQNFVFPSSQVKMFENRLIEEIEKL
ncbi:MAG: D-alanyl-D-alanine carboxypeptidase/D-alanyl-D-alanine-endopeptidase [Candidatus Gastranaerophilales bacterium]|nr:D-alanyl-D-alanine carboxypeptidase/D-alanyl-D-alanine-endopeptidase [Candidatus Gastranaerophilales bacterium]